MPLFTDVELVPGDPILSLNDTYNADTRTNKVNLGIGIYCDESGCIPLLRAVQQVEEQLAKHPKPRGYLPIDGLPAYIKATQQLLFGVDSPLLTAGRVATSQTIGGSGALRVTAEVLKQVLPHATVAISRPSWENHRALFTAAGFKIEDYTYFDTLGHAVDFTGMVADLAKLQPKTVVLLHGCCHNPTGADLSRDQWKQLVALFQERQLLPCIDLAYQGFNQGIDADAYAIRLLAEEGISNYVVANSYSKSFSLYGERVGGLSIVASNTEQAQAIQSQVKRIIRTIYSSPSAHGAYLVAGVLNSHELRTLWEQELTQMRERIHGLRAGLVARLTALGAPEFDFIQRQAGMFSYSGLSKIQVDRLRDEFGIYAVSSGRICVAALSQHKLEYVAQAVVKVHQG
ncbi:aromatic amino acid aminotransferase [Xylella fastidiosa]|uniref:Aminotransferase n=1 Tax=Xylella fastidiosa (strain 9a5c) TaxID=160492 RepID=Q9PHA8_XYLFA|nr:amino acid aminotransferase [Xylella fastidiosa]AAF82849.1 aromatic-amino-acid aminotranferase [Xylella fastidiosa 9a5c]ALQ93822.1 aromatic amino acid aminotransferase [Xylella fastidiosa]TNW22521.1 aspartate/tyrosine/aromatic aminotransferase [Xylella fastidiosa subsp. pauca]